MKQIDETDTFFYKHFCFIICETNETDLQPWSVLVTKQGETMKQIPFFYL